MNATTAAGLKRLGQSLCVVAMVLSAIPLHADTVTVSTTQNVSIPHMGTANPYPVEIPVSGLRGSIESLAVTLIGVSHQWSQDLDVLLVGPGGQKSLLMSYTGGSESISNVRLTFQDGAPALPQTARITSGTYRPTTYSEEYWYSGMFPSPAPGEPYGVVLAAFSGTDPNGMWKLFVVDNAYMYSGSLKGVELTFTGVEIPEPAALGVLAMGGLAMLRRRRTA